MPKAMFSRFRFLALVGILAVGLGGTAIADITTDLDAHWTFDETEGDFQDSSPNDYDAAPVGEVYGSGNNGIIGGAMDLDGFDDANEDGKDDNPEYASSANAGNFEFDEPFSGSMWVKLREEPDTDTPSISFLSRGCASTTLDHSWDFRDGDGSGGTQAYKERRARRLQLKMKFADEWDGPSNPGGSDFSPNTSTGQVLGDNWASGWMHLAFSYNPVKYNFPNNPTTQAPASNPNYNRRWPFIGMTLYVNGQAVNSTYSYDGESAEDFTHLPHLYYPEWAEATFDDTDIGYEVVTAEGNYDSPYAGQTIRSTRPMSIGARGYDEDPDAAKHSGAINGEVDDTGIWARALEAKEMALIHGMGRFESLAINDPRLQAAMDVFDAATGSVVINGHKWVYATGLSGALGATSDYASTGGGDYIVLDGAGNGLKLLSPPSGMVFLIR